MNANEILTAKAGTTTRATVARILDHWNRATPAQREQGAQWYGEAQQVASDMVASKPGLTLEAAAAVIAHLSPRTSWARNVAGAMALVTTGEAPACIGANVDRARAALTASNPLETVRGPKTAAFARNILGDPDVVTVDVWAVRIALGDQDDPELVLRKSGVYDAVAHCYRLAARKAGVSPSTMQAATWIVSRGGRAA